MRLNDKINTKMTKLFFVGLFLCLVNIVALAMSASSMVSLIGASAHVVCVLCSIEFGYLLGSWEPKDD
jgi:hypothetical protein